MQGSVWKEDSVRKETGPLFCLSKRWIGILVLPLPDGSEFRRHHSGLRRHKSGSGRRDPAIAVHPEAKRTAADVFLRPPLVSGALDPVPEQRFSGTLTSQEVAVTLREVTDTSRKVRDTSPRLLFPEAHASATEIRCSETAHGVKGQRARASRHLQTRSKSRPRRAYHEPSPRSGQVAV